MGILSWIGVGLVAGILAKILIPGKDPGGWIITILLGIGGAAGGGYVASRFLGWGDVSGFNLYSIAIATGGALVILIIYRILFRSRG